MKRQWFIGVSLLVFTVFLTNCGNDKKAAATEVSCGRVDCDSPPVSANASEAEKAAQKQLEGKWSFLSVRQLSKANKQESYNTAASMRVKNDFCFSTKGGAVLSAKGATCVYCYQVKQDSTGKMALQVSGTGGQWCQYQLESGYLEFKADSMYINIDTRLETKRYMYYRLKDLN